MANSAASVVISRARNTLSDTDATAYRWSDTQLLELLNEGLERLLIDTEILETSGLVKLQDNVQHYTMEPYALKITRIEHDYGALPFYSHKEMDKKVAQWYTTNGNIPEAIIYDKGNRGEFQVYPTPGTSVIPIQSNSPFGVVTSVSNIDSATMIYDSEGLIADGTIAEYLKVFYVAKPAILATTADLLPTDPMWDTALKHYIAGMALRTNQDTQNRAMGQEELQMYAASTNTMKNFTSGDFTNKRSRRTSYNGGI